MKKEQKELEQEAEEKQLTPVEDEEFIKFEKIGEKVRGIFKEQGYSDRYQVPIYTVGDKRFLGKTQLDRLMKKVTTGELIEVELVDTQKTPKGTMKIFEVRK